MTHSTAVLSPSLPAHALMCRFDADSPACTSYPAVNRFVEAIGAEDVARSLRLEASRSRLGGMATLAIRVNIAFFDPPADWCACKPVAARRRARAAHYLRALQNEVDQAVRDSGSGRRVSRIHVGGGAPLELSNDELAQVLALLRESFNVAADSVISIEAVASLCTRERVAALCSAGFNRLFVAIDDMQCVATDGASLKLALETARGSGFMEVTTEVPGVASWRDARELARAITEVTTLRPEHLRITPLGALPHRQRVVIERDAARSVSTIERSCRLRHVFERLMSAGYVHLGLDEFALPETPLVAASRQGRLHLGVRGFSTRSEGDVLALGASAIGRIGAVAYQNVERLADYDAALQDGRLPVARGLVLARDDLARECVIKGLLCQGRVAFESISLSHLVDMRAAFSQEFALLEPLIQSGLVELDDEALELTSAGTWFAPLVAGVFDRELQRDALRLRLSRDEGV
jgi:oxygen-independent coproporphyrinogen-3 oxidase